MNNTDSKLIGISNESINLLYAIELFRNFPKHYILGLRLPNTELNKMYFYDELEKILDDEYPDVDEDEDDDSIIDHKIEIYAALPISSLYLHLSSLDDDIITESVGNIIEEIIQKLYDVVDGSLYPYKNYVFMVLKLIFKELATELLVKIGQYNSTSIDMIEEVRPDLIGRFNKPVKRMLLFEQ